MEEEQESNFLNESIFESPEFKRGNPRMREIVKKVMKDRVKKAAVKSLNRSVNNNSSFIFRQASAMQVKNKVIIKELVKARAFNTQLENTVKRFREQHLALAMRLASAERRLKEMIAKDAAKQSIITKILHCKEDLTSLLKAFEHAEADAECSPLENFSVSSLECRPQRVLKGIPRQNVLNKSCIIKSYSSDQKISKTNASIIMENSEEINSTDHEECNMSLCDDGPLEAESYDMDQGEQDLKEKLSDEIIRPDEESPMKLDLNVSFSSESSFSSLKHLGLQSNCSVDMQGNDEVENISIANQPVLDLDEEGGTTMQEHNIALEKSQIQIEHPPQNKIAQQVEKNNISEGTNKSTTDTLAKSKKRNRSSVKSKRSSKVVQQTESNNDAYDVLSISNDSFILNPTKVIKLTSKNNSRVEIGRKLTCEETAKEVNSVLQEDHSGLNKTLVQKNKSPLSVTNWAKNNRIANSDSFLFDPSKSDKLASTTNSKARSKSHDRTELNDENEKPVRRSRLRRKVPVNYVEPSLIKKLRREESADEKICGS